MPETIERATGAQDFRLTMKVVGWRVVDPRGRERVARARTRTAAIARAMGGGGMLPPTLRRLLGLDACVAGWAPIEADGWTVEPIREMTVTSAGTSTVTTVTG